METNTVTQSSGAASTQTTAQESGSILTSDFEVFLQMLTTQARYQDPLEPIDSSEYSAQLAQFSMVEQQVMTNELMERLVSALNTSDGANLANWIGMDALNTGPVQFDGTPVTVVPNPPTGAEEMYLVARDSSGTAVQTQQIPVSTDAVQWSGEQADGTPLPQGQYTLSIETRSQGEVLQVDPAQTYSRVLESRLVDGEMRLILAGGHTVSTAEVVGLRAPQS